MATYNLTITSKANKTFTRLGLPERLVQSHRSFDASVPTHAIRVIENYLHNNYGNFYFCAGQNAMNRRYIRVVIDIRAGSKTREEKQQLLRRTLECCQEYEGRKASECTVEIRINEVDDENVMLFDSEDAAGVIGEAGFRRVLSRRSQSVGEVAENAREERPRRTLSRYQQQGQQQVDDGDMALFAPEVRK